MRRAGYCGWTAALARGTLALHMTDLARAISGRVARLRAGTDPALLARMRSGWAIFAKQQPEAIAGGCMLLPDSVAPSLNALGEAERSQFLADFAALGDAVLAATGAERVNYLVLCNLVPELHAHCIPRFASEDRRLRMLDPFAAYDFASAPLADVSGVHRELFERLRRALESVQAARVR